MKTITKSQLKQMIKEAVLKEQHSNLGLLQDIEYAAKDIAYQAAIARRQSLSLDGYQELVRLVREIDDMVKSLQVPN